MQGVNTVRRSNLLSVPIRALLQGRMSLFADPVIDCRVVLWYYPAPQKTFFVDDLWNVLKINDRRKKDDI